MKRLLIACGCLCLLAACHHKPSLQSRIERWDPRLDSLVSPDAHAEVIACGYHWTEGPLWDPAGQRLLFSDVPANAIYQWTETGGASLYLKPSGYTDTVRRGGETGSNGLAFDLQGRLVLCQQGNRQVARMEAPLNQPAPVFRALAARYQNKRFDSPNDLVLSRSGDLFFTDPPYGLEKYVDDPAKDAPYQGVYRVKPDGRILLLCDTLTRPNGIGFMPGGRTLVVANSDPEKAIWYAFDLADPDSLTHARILYDATAAGRKDSGSPDGFKIDSHGNLFGTGPGGIWIIDSTGRALGRIRIPGRISNCAFTPDERTLFVTADSCVLRIRLR
ncbi:MAG TPA: SMP-30/gluconolactonase/LRE family protein [Chitinophagaceae bacterium]|nr:SMP-30/gluconolactonase/LRE family protein [Chitinophagaceae bacterium]